MKIKGNIEGSCFLIHAPKGIGKRQKTSIHLLILFYTVSFRIKI